MAYHIMSVPCLRIIHDKGTNLPSLMDIVEVAYAGPDGQLSLPPFKLYSKWGRSKPPEETDDFEVKISITVPSASRKKLVDKFPVKIPEKATGVTISIDVSPIKVNELGRVMIHIDWRANAKAKWKQAATIPVYLKQSSHTDDEEG